MLVTIEISKYQGVKRIRPQQYVHGFCVVSELANWYNNIQDEIKDIDVHEYKTVKLSYQLNFKHDILESYKRTDTQIELTMNNIKDVCSGVFNITDIKKRTRAREWSTPRQWAAMFAYLYSSYSVKEIGLELGIDHATVLHGVKNIKNLLDAGDVRANEELNELSLVFNINTEELTKKISNIIVGKNMRRKTKN